MKLNIEVEIDYLDENGSLDEIVKKEIAAKIINSVSKKVETEMQEEATKAISGKIDEICNLLIGEFLKRKVNITDKWGKEIICDTTIEDILKNKFDEFWNQNVDDSGRSGCDSYVRTRRRFEWLIDKQIEDHSKKFADKLIKETSDKITKSITENLKTQIGNEVVSKLGVNKFLIENKD
jgi:uncharacterized protein YjgD (DUF1641 family)